MGCDYKHSHFFLIPQLTSPSKKPDKWDPFPRSLAESEHFCQWGRSFQRFFWSIGQGAPFRILFSNLYLWGCIWWLGTAQSNSGVSLIFEEMNQTGQHRMPPKCVSRDVMRHWVKARVCGQLCEKHWVKLSLSSFFTAGLFRAFNVPMCTVYLQEELGEQSVFPKQFWPWNPLFKGISQD